MNKINKEEIYNRSIIFTGPMGAGKTLISRELENVLNLPVVSTDLLRHCPHDIKQIEERKKEIDVERNYLKLKISSCADEKEKRELKQKLYDLNAEFECRNRQIEMRNFLGDIKNYDDMGFDERATVYLRENFGEVAWHFYQKKFENALLEEIVNALPSPCILDLGGGMTISLDDDYKKLYSLFSSIDKNLTEKHLCKDLHFNKIKTILKPFKNITYLKLPDNYKSQKTRASETHLNDIFISTGQYDKVATKTISVEGLIENGKINQTKLDSIISKTIEVPNKKKDKTK